MSVLTTRARAVLFPRKQLRTVVLLNLGSLVDLAQYFNLSPLTTLHVIDSHRPCNLDNLFSAMPDADRVVVWDDGDVDEDMKEEKEAFEALQVSLVMLWQVAKRKAERSMILIFLVQPRVNSTNRKAIQKKSTKIQTTKICTGENDNGVY